MSTPDQGLTEVSAQDSPHTVANDALHVRWYLTYDIGIFSPLLRSGLRHGKRVRPGTDVGWT